MNPSFWDSRYGQDDYAYGIEPNDFLRAEAGRIPPGRVLCLAEGEGRNAVYLAGLGYQVTAVDYSIEGLRKAERLARARGLAIELVHADLADYAPPAGAFSGVVSIWAHLPLPVRRQVHGQMRTTLTVGGCLLVEAYTPAQLAHGTGGPRDVSMLYTLDAVRAELSGLDLVVAREVEREVHEGEFHDGRSATLQVVGIRRA